MKHIPPDCLPGEGDFLFPRAAGASVRHCGRLRLRADRPASGAEPGRGPVRALPLPRSGHALGACAAGRQENDMSLQGLAFLGY